jgi:hypothetical protein
VGLSREACENAGDPDAADPAQRVRRTAVALSLLGGEGLAPKGKWLTAETGAKQ